MLGKHSNITTIHSVTVFPIDISKFHIFVDSKFLLEIKLVNFISNKNFSQKDKKYLILYAILRSWGLVLPISYLIK